MQRIIIAALLLAGCQSTDPIDTGYKALDKQIESVRKTLPADCQTPAVMAQLTALEQQAVAIKATCETTVQLEKEKNNGLRWKLALAGLGYLLIALFFYMREKGKWSF